MYLYWKPTITTLLTSSTPNYGYQCQKHNILSFYHNNWKGWSNSAMMLASPTKPQWKGKRRPKIEKKKKGKEYFIQKREEKREK